jgi:hypothetical protein
MYKQTFYEEREIILFKHKLDILQKSSKYLRLTFKKAKRYNTRIKNCDLNYDF